MAQESLDQQRAAGRRDRRWAVSAVLVCAIASCAIPGRLYSVAPAIQGSIRGMDSSADEIDLRLNVMHREGLNLFEIQRIRLSREQEAFRFDPVELEIAGREYSKFYRVFLHYQSGSEEAVLWRGEFSRNRLAGSIELDCQLDRPPRLGQPCQVRDPLRHPWLIDAGERTFNRLCTSCHGAGGTGSADSGAAAPIRPPDLTRIAARRGGSFDPAAIAEWVEGTRIPMEHGTRVMPIWGERLSDEYWRYANADELVGATLDPVIVYLESIQR